MDLVIGIGNRLRGDDGIGPSIVEGLPAQTGVTCRVVHQLTPELVMQLAEVDRVLFVDAAISGEAPRIEAVCPRPHSGLGHAMTPAALMDLARTICHKTPKAWLLTVPGIDFEFGERFSPVATAHLPEATHLLHAWLAGSVPVTT